MIWSMLKSSLEEKQVSKAQELDGKKEQLSILTASNLSQLPITASNSTIDLLKLGLMVFVDLIVKNTNGLVTGFNGLQEKILFSHLMMNMMRRTLMLPCSMTKVRLKRQKLSWKNLVFLVSEIILNLQKTPSQNQAIKLCQMECSLATSTDLSGCKHQLR